MLKTRGEDRRKWDVVVQLPVGFVDRRCLAERRRPVLSEASLEEFCNLRKSLGAGDDKSR